MRENLCCGDYFSGYEVCYSREGKDWVAAAVEGESQEHGEVGGQSVTVVLVVKDGCSNGCSGSCNSKWWWWRWP